MDAQLRELEFMDVHVGAEVHRVVLDGIPRLPGESVREQARYLEREADGLRRLLLEEPRGALPSFSVDLVTRAGNPRAHAGVIIMEYMGYPMFSGSNLMATATALVETGRIALPGNMGTVALESPGGLARVRVERGRNRVESTRYESSSPAFVASRGHEVHLTSYGRVRFDVVWSGVFYAVVDARVHGFSLLREEEAALGRITRFFPVGLMASREGDEYLAEMHRSSSEVPAELKERRLRYSVKVRLLGGVRVDPGRGGGLRFVPTSRRLPHLGAKVGVPSEEVMEFLCGLSVQTDDASAIGVYALGETVFDGGPDGRYRR